MNKYLKAIVACLGALGMVGIPVTLDGGFTPATGISGVIGAVMVFLVWLVQNEPLIKQDIAAVTGLVAQEKSHGGHPAVPSPSVPAPGASPVAVAAALKTAVPSVAAVVQDLAPAVTPLIDRVISSTPLSAAERQAIADEWAKVSAASPTPAQ